MPSLAAGGGGGVPSCAQTLAMAMDPSIKRERKPSDSQDERRKLHPREEFGPMREKNSGWCAEEVRRTVEMMPAGMAPDSAQSRRVERAANAATGVRARRVYTDEEAVQAILDVARGAKMAAVSRRSGVSVDTIEKYRNKLIDAGRWQLGNAELLAELKGLEFRGPGPLPYLTDDEIKTALIAAAAGKVIGQPMPKAHLRANIAEAAHAMGREEIDPARRAHLENAN